MSDHSLTNRVVFKTRNPLRLRNLFKCTSKSVLNVPLYTCKSLLVIQTGNELLMLSTAELSVRESPVKLISLHNNRGDLSRKKKQ